MLLTAMYENIENLIYIFCTVGYVSSGYLPTEYQLYKNNFKE